MKKHDRARAKWHNEVRPRFTKYLGDGSASAYYGVAELIAEVDRILPSFEGGFLIPAGMAGVLISPDDWETLFPPRKARRS